MLAMQLLIMRLISRKHNQVHIFNYSKASHALPSLIQQALEHKNISYYENHELISISKPHFVIENGPVSSLRALFAKQSRNALIKLDCRGAKNAPRNDEILEFDYLVTAIGREAQKDFYTKNLKLQERKLLKLNKLFLIGDVKNNICRQASIATGDGILTAMQIGEL